MNRPTHGGNLIWAAGIAGCPASVIVDFSASINPLGPPQSAITSINKGMQALTAYPDPEYSHLCGRLGKFHQLTPEWILPGNGSAELLTWASLELSNLDWTYVVTPAFGDYWRALKTFGAKVKTTGLKPHSGKWGLTVPCQHQSAEQIGLLLNNPHNPTGQLFSRDELLPFLDSFALVVVDEAFMDFLPPSQQESLISLVPDYPNLVILRSLTKFYSLPGLRLGYAISHPDRLRVWQKWRDPWAVNILADLAAQAVIEDSEFQQKTWDWLVPTRAKLCQKINSIPGLKSQEGAANFLLVETSKPCSQVQEFLLKNHQLLIRDCLSFPELGDAYFRIAVKTDQDNQRLIQGLTEFFRCKHMI